jgi:hypothetical protein
MTAVDRWIRRNSLQLNVKKTSLLIIHSSRKKPTTCDVPLTLSVNGSDLDFPTTDTMRWLDVLFDVNLTMTEHMRRISATCFAILRMIRRIRSTLNMHSTRLLCNSMVISRVDYCNAILINSDKSNIKKLQGIMNLAARLIKRIPRQEHITALLKELGWLPAEYRIKRKVSTLVFKALTSNRPAYLCEHLVE